MKVKTIQLLESQDWLVFEENQQRFLTSLAAYQRSAGGFSTTSITDVKTAKGSALGTIPADGMSAMLGKDEKAQVFSDVEITSNCTALILWRRWYHLKCSWRDSILENIHLYYRFHTLTHPALERVEMCRLLSSHQLQNYNTAKIIPQKSTSSQGWWRKFSLIPAWKIGWKFTLVAQGKLSIGFLRLFAIKTSGLVGNDISGYCYLAGLRGFSANTKAVC
ncbi:predicted protein [Coccidioides posadasii str. Silveira]|uniref:Predicted protein n=2 Tax=Coccidioides posadasii TaxID=199306 RepID=E9D0N3_COCPS|nr:predicted protein [Coccidioides posadasii str. Silveira]KMM73542.1 hypothetical protein CPAG_09829 [Coccidioides posadasii RMSCC 3488]